MIDRAVPGDSIVRRKQHEKLERYQRLKDDLEKVRKVHSVIVVPVVIGTLGAVSPKVLQQIPGLTSEIPVQKSAQSVLKAR